MVHLHVQRTIHAAPERVFDWMMDPANLLSAPLFLRARWANGSSAPAAGAFREVTVIGAWLREQITAYDPPTSYSYHVVRSFPAVDHECGTVTLTSLGEATRIDWVTTYTIPARGGGRLTEAITAPLFRSSFRAILAGCAKALES
ncbi:SRPBCC family protein [[Mycobacterium] nativiensis]|uniref:SRPBCC family protein n=1 Tax=[Mycobacterium] nativiensis TaxID=2855503 RepID=A0ABU5XVZ2_9MYCO|nr:SRPBCC family protein [Mycolicibacter sp. MYC340]MEB3031957.1 SRPBCC family protein [Mycolicibacter sp. MYC340]